VVFLGVKLWHSNGLFNSSGRGENFLREAPESPAERMSFDSIPVTNEAENRPLKLTLREEGSVPEPHDSSEVSMR
jgi:hypothetical protein